jgi:hypothetical protein
MEDRHKRRAHARHNANDTVSEVRETSVRNRGGRSLGVPNSREAPPRDALLSLSSEQSHEEQPDTLSIDDPATRHTLESFFETGRKMLSTIGAFGNDTDRPLTEQERAVLITIKDLVNRLDGLGRVDDDEDADKVVFAFEHPEWSSKGFTRKDHLPWTAVGLAPEEAAQWRDAGFTIDDAVPWLNQNKSIHGVHKKFVPSDAKVYRDAGISPSEGAHWSLVLGAPADDAMKWISAGVSRDDATGWIIHAKCDYETYHAWNELGVTDPGDAMRLDWLGSDRINAWQSVGVPLEDIPRMMQWEHYKDCGYTEKDLLIAKNTGNSLDYLQSWLENRVPADQIAEFIEKGYTPKRAVSRITKGETAATAEDLRNGEPVPGNAWVTFKEALDSKVTANDYECDVIEKREKDGKVSIEVFCYRGGDRTGGIVEDYSLMFSNTGAFKYCSSGYDSRVGSVNQVISTYFAGYAT